MLSLSPAKLLVILIVALLVLGPEKLPQVARQLGAAWHDLRRWRARLESEVRGTFPNMPPVHEVAQAVRSPFAFLDRLADEHERGVDQEHDGEAAPAGDGGPAPPVASSGNGSGSFTPASGADATAGNGTSGNGTSGNGVPGPGGPSASPAAVPGAFPAVPDDPSMN
jgi:sec-independent protein translocase protein TatB